jgi:hypothetical protein
MVIKSPEINSEVDLEQGIDHIPSDNQQVVSKSSLYAFLIVGTILFISGCLNINNECLVSSKDFNIAWFLIILGLCIEALTVLYVILISDYLPLVIKNAITAILFVPLLGIIVIPTVMVVMLFTIPHCGLTSSIFIFLYIIIASLFNMGTIVFVIIVKYTIDYFDN